MLKLISRSHSVKIDWNLIGSLSLCNFIFRETCQRESVKSRWTLMFMRTTPNVYKNIPYLLRREILHASGHAISENREISGCQGCWVLAKVVEVLPRTMITQIREQLAVHDVLQYKIMRLCNQKKITRCILYVYSWNGALERIAFRIK